MKQKLIISFCIKCMSFSDADSGSEIFSRMPVTAEIG